MNVPVSVLAVALLALSSGTVFASAAAAPLPVSTVVSHLEGRYGGEVVAIVLDDGGDKAAHYHVDLRYPVAGIARLDVDAASLAIAPRLAERPQSRWTTTLPDAVALAAKHVPGQVLASALDTSDGAQAHYDIDIRVATGAIARVKVDPRNAAIAWRTPAVIVE